MQKFRLAYGTDRQGFFWPASEQKRAELLSVKRNSPADFEAIYQGRPGQREGAIFLDGDFAYYKIPLGLELGRADPEVNTICSKGHGVFQAWDTAFSQTNDSAHTACVTGLFVACNRYHRGESEIEFGPCEAHFDVYILDVLRSKMDWGGLVKAFRGMATKWRPDLIIVEKRASGISLFQSMQSAGLPIKGVDVPEGKMSRAIHGTVAGSAQGWFRQHRVKFPRTASWLERYRTELKDFSGADDSPSDQVDASVHLIAHAIDIGSTAAMLPTDWQPESAEQMPEMAWEREQAAAMINPNPRAETLMFLGMLPDLSVDPYMGTCARCLNYEKTWCKIQKRHTIAFDSCAAFTAPQEAVAHA